jgi:hypothetical protein
VHIFLPDDTNDRHQTEVLLLIHRSHGHENPAGEFLPCHTHAFIRSLIHPIFGNRLT